VVNSPVVTLPKVVTPPRDPPAVVTLPKVAPALVTLPKVRRALVEQFSARRATNPLPTSAAAGEADTSGQLVAGGVTAFAGFLVLGTAFVLRRREGDA
jgi:hypothetical protein